ncbi:LURP-one-related/scramblase family protein [Halobacterium bonnevillei]|uniref:Uncharacterized protein n=1 Tax=Halobacterium bonnevillei TaxID=2692200 RepID=A0A6B0SJF8_9EURY|nr:hypothetical protein [Halobacterium bonnevillei]MXR21838.1 hypothetical protein [Halobacterium bonnevillei]
MSEPSTGDAEAGEYDISTVVLDDDTYEVRQSLIRNKYAVRDSTGTVVLRAKQKLFKLKEQFPFVTGDDEPAFTVTAGGMLDIGGTYTIVDDGTGEEVVVLDEDYSLFVENWTVRDPETGDALATIKSKSKLLAALRHLVGAANLFPNKYEIFDPSGGHVGDIAGTFSLRDTYTVTVDDASDVPKEAVVAAACVLDALENE